LQHGEEAGHRPRRLNLVPLSVGRYPFSVKGNGQRTTDNGQRIIGCLGRG
jgi:hypothetical protein